MTTETLVLAGGCFWCTEAVFEQVRGVLDVESGYSNGQAERPTYEEVCTGATGCAEVVKLVYDPAVIGVRDLLTIFFATHDPTTPNRQGNDVGTQYRSGIYYSDPTHEQVAAQLLHQLQQEQAFGAPIVTELQPLGNFWPAESYHQDFYERNPNQGYCNFVVAPKVSKFRKTFARHLKPDA